MKTKLNISTVVLALSGFIVVQTATAQAPNPHPAQEALKGLQPFIGNWAGEFEAIGGFEGLAKGKMVTGTERVRWILNKTAVQMTWDNKFKDDGKSFNFGTGIITLDPVSKKLNWSSFGYDGKVYWTGKGVVELKTTGLHFDIEENTINKTNTKYQSTRLKTNRKTMIVQHKNLVQNGKKIGDLKEIKMTRVPFKKTTFDIDSARSQIDEQNKKYMGFYNNGDASGVADLHVDEAIVMPPHVDLVKGKEAIKQAISDEILAGATDLVFTTLDMYGNEDYVTEVGRFSLNIKDKGNIVMNDSGKYICIWKQVSKNNWLIKADTWNSDLPIK
jgi:ketosteroid isomerase-like protein